MSHPKNVGIKAIEIYVPGQVHEAPNYIITLTNRIYQTLDQADFETYQGVSAGKYTIGLGSTSMNFCNDREGETH